MTATDTVTFSAVAAILATVALIATVVPASRAARMDLMIALRQIALREALREE